MLRSIHSLLPSPNRRTLSILLFTSILCLLSYLLGLYIHSRPSSAVSIASSAGPPSSDCPLVASPLLPPPLFFLPRHAAASSFPPLPSPLPDLPFCPSNFSDYCPCQDTTRERHFSMRSLFHRERHCPDPEERVRCRIPKPRGYRRTVPWPESRNYAWFANVPSKRLTESKKDQNWVRLEGDRLVFPGGGTSFPYGVKWYVNEMAKLVPLKSGEVRTVLDIGCGVASFGGHLVDYNILTMSVAPRDVHEAQVQFALERGLPAMLGVLSTYRLPYPSRSFDMAHCARCLIKWAGHEGSYLIEIDRVLRPGGYWVLSGPPINWKNFYKGWGRTAQDLEEEQIAIENLAKRLCWKKTVEKGPIAVWRKPTNHVHCLKKSKILKSPPFCDGTDDPDAAWYKRLKSCITPLPKVDTIDEIAGGALAKWQKRLTAVPPRISSGLISGVTSQTFNHDNQIWNHRISHYTAYISSIKGSRYRNIMDMNSGLGGFAAALSKYSVWVMNVVPTAKNNTLGVIYERGLIGTYMDWCEAFSTYPRTYDFIHADSVFSLYMDKCDIIDILLEMDRILRPEGAVIIRDHVDTIGKVKKEADRLKWQSRIVHNENGPFDTEKLLIVDNSVELSSSRVS